MKCLSVSQPFADLIISKKKTIELRKWNTNFRGEFLIHSPLRIRKEDCERLKINKKFVTGAIIGKVELYDVKRYNSIKEVRDDQKFHFASKHHFDNKFGFILKNAKALKVPIPYKGKLGFFDVNLPKSRIKSKDLLTEIIDEEFRYQWIGHH